MLVLALLLNDSGIAIGGNNLLGLSFLPSPGNAIYEVEESAPFTYEHLVRDFNLRLPPRV